MSAGHPSREEVVAFLAGQPGTPQDLEELTGGAWSSAWAYRAGGEELVVRLGPEVSWYEADRMAMAFGGPDLPVPEVREVGTTRPGGPMPSRYGTTDGSLRTPRWSRPLPSPQP